MMIMLAIPTLKNGCDDTDSDNDESVESKDLDDKCIEITDSDDASKTEMNPGKKVTW